MGWRGPRVEGELPSLGWELLDWMAEFLPSPRDPAEPLVFTDEQARLLVAWYTIDPHTGRFVYRRGCSRRAKGWGKSPFEAAKALAELAGPVRFAGWDAAGEPVGRPWGVHGDPSAWVQIGAVSEDQTENTHSVVHYFLTANDGRAADELRVDAGLTRSFLRDGARTGKLEPVTSAAGTREGQPITYAVMDETHLWKSSNGGVRLARTMRRNAAKMNGRTYETTNAFEPGEGTVAEQTHRAAERGAEGVFYDAVEAPPVDLESASDGELREAFRVAYGDSWWVDVDRLVAEARDPDMPVEDVQRFFCNWNVKGGGRAVDPRRWDELGTGERPPAGTRIGLGFDGSISGDCTVLVGCSADGVLFLVDEWTRPRDAGDDWRVPRLEVHAAVERAFVTWDVGLMLCDPPKWWTEIETWAERYRLRDGTDRVVALDTNSERRFAPACDRWFTAIREGSVSHDGDAVLTEHVVAASKRKTRVRDDEDDGRTLFVLTKSADRRKIDAAVAAVLAHQAAMTMPEAPPARKPLAMWR